MAGKLTKQFLDRPAVIAAIGAARARVLTRSAAYVRQIARRSLRRRKQASAPGSPPSVHSSNPTINLKNIQFAWDAASGHMIVGPVGVDNYRPDVAEQTDAAVPGLLEHGGTVRLLVAYDARHEDGYLPRTQAQVTFADHVRTASFRMRPRPFMAPALKVAAPKLAEFWKGQVTG